MRIISSDRQAIFDHLAIRPNLVGAWPDFYALIRVSERATPVEIEDAIVGAVADVVLSDMRRDHDERIVLLRRHVHDLRPVLLEAERRARYDMVLARHRRREQAPDYAEWRQGEKIGLRERLRHGAGSWRDRVRANLRETPYL